MNTRAPQGEITRDEQRSEDWEQIARLICRELAALKKAGWMPPFSVVATNADDEHVFALEYDERFVTTDDVSRVLPDLKFPIAITITDAAGGHSWVEITEILTVQ